MTPKDRLVQLALQFFANEPPCNCGSAHGCCIECVLQRDIRALVEEEGMTVPQRRTYRIFGAEGETVSCRYLYSIAEIEEKDIPKGIDSHGPLTSGDEADQRTIEDGHGKVATFNFVATHDADGEEIAPQNPNPRRRDSLASPNNPLVARSSTMPLSQKHILGVRQFTQDDINLIYGRVALLTGMKPSKLVKRLRGQTLACVFYEPSTRTSASFIAAMGQLGGNVIPITQGVQFSSVAKGETLEDTIVTLGQYADAIVLRHPETGSVERAAAVSPVPIINAGDGIGEHPTQALLDLYTIQKEVAYPGKHMHVAFVGDLANGRTVHSLAVLLARYPFVRFDLISPEALQLKGPVYDEIQDKVDSVHFVRKGLHEVQGILHAADVVYMTRVQKERFCDGGSYETVKDSCLLTPELVEGMKTSARIMHPLPRVNEIPTEIDSDPRAAYFREVRAGLLVRRALLDLILDGGSE